MTSSTAAADSCVRIRIVDDQASVRDSLAFMLRQEGFECVCYESAKEFLIDDMPSVPGCLLLDVQMPQMSGLELQQELIRRGSTLRIVFLSAYGTIDMAVDKAMSMPDVNLIGLHFHIGSQLLDFTPYKMLCDRINDLQDHFEARGISFKIINVGGGLGINYENPNENPIPDFKNYFDTFRNNLKLRKGQELHFELGRAIVGQCGSLITRVIYVKNGTTKNFVIVDAGMTDLIRPALYQAHHVAENITSSATETARYDIVGPICESSDKFASDETLPLTHRGDLLALRSAGAYGEVMAMQYNCRNLPSTQFSR